MLVKCKFLDADGELKGRAYTYSAPDDLTIGELAETPEGKKVAIVEIDVSPEQVKGFEDKIKGVLRIVEADGEEVPDFNKQELITVEQLPIIKEQFRIAGEEVRRRVAEADSLVCTEENKQAVKKARAQLRKELAAFEERFKEVETEILEPWNNIKNAYKEFISLPYAEGDKRLKAKIDAIEEEQKGKKQEEIKAYFEEYAQSRHVDIVQWEQAGIKVGLSDTVKSLKEQAKAFIDRIENDLRLIEAQEHKEEILVEYRRSLNASQAVTTVVARHKAIEEQKIKQAELETKKAVDAEVVKRAEKAAGVSSLAPPVAKGTKHEDDPILTVNIGKVTHRKSELIWLKKTLNERGFKYGC